MTDRPPLPPIPESFGLRVWESEAKGAFYFRWPILKGRSQSKTFIYTPYDAAERVMIGSLMAELWYLFVDHIGDCEPRVENKHIADAVKNAERWRRWAGLNVDAYSNDKMKGL